MEVRTAKLEIRPKDREGESMQTRENESQIRGEERKRGSETDRHTML